MLGGMAALPGTDWTDTRSASSDALGMVRHVFTHFALELSVERGLEPIGEGWWEPIDRLGEAGLPTLYRKAADLALEALPNRRRAA